MLHPRYHRKGASSRRLALAAAVITVSSASWVRAGDGGTGCEIVKLLPADGASPAFPAFQGNFGNAAAVSGDVAIVGAYGDGDQGANSGAAYLFRRDAAGVWKEFQKLTAPGGGPSQYFGIDVDIDGDTAVVGAALANAAYVFRDAGDTWMFVQELGASDPGPDQFGVSVAVHGQTIVVGASAADSFTGSAYVFRRVAPGTWVEVDKVTAPDGVADDFFGGAVDIFEDVILVGAYHQMFTSVLDGPGAAYLFRNDGADDWTLEDKLTSPDGFDGQQLGIAVALHGNTAIVGAWQHFDFMTGLGSGAAYVFRDSGAGAWALLDKLTATRAADGDLFGVSVALDGDTAIVGARQDSERTGFAAAFRDKGVGGWVQVDTFAASDGAVGDEFGHAVALDDSTVLIGAWRDDDNGLESGSAYVFDLACRGQGILGDLDGDDTVDGVDLAMLLGQWSGAVSYTPCPPHKPADLNQDCKVNGLDLAMLLGAWG